MTTEALVISSRLLSVRFQEPVIFELVIKLKTAMALGLRPFN